MKLLFQELKLTSWDGGSWAKDIMRRLIQSLPNLEVLAIHTASAIIDVTNEETIQKWDVLLDIVKYVSGCKKLRWLRFDVMDQLSFIPFLKKFGVSNLLVVPHFFLTAILSGLRNCFFFFFFLRVQSFFSVGFSFTSGFPIWYMNFFMMQ